MLKPTNVNHFIDTQNQGKLKQALALLLSDAAIAVTEHGRQATIDVQFKIKQLGDGNQVTVETTIKNKRPTSKGNRSEDQTTATAMHVGQEGNLSLMPENQTDMFDDVDGVTMIKKESTNA